MRAVIYARYSSDAQREASIADQVRLCRELAERQGWQVAEVYADHALSGASSLRPGYQRLLAPTAQKIKASRFWERRRAMHLLTGLLVCSECGGGYASVGRDYLACANARKLATCNHRTGLRRAQVEELILDLVRDRLLAPDAVAAFVAGYTEELNRDRAGATARRTERELRLSKLERGL